jgi:hypothetical protein
MYNKTNLFTADFCGENDPKRFLSELLRNYVPELVQSGHKPRRLFIHPKINYLLLLIC